MGLAAEAKLTFGDCTYFSGKNIKAGANRAQSQTAFHPVLVALPSEGTERHGTAHGTWCMYMPCRTVLGGHTMP